MNLPPEAKEILARTARVLHQAGVDESVQHLVEADLLLMYVCGSTETIRGMIERLNAERSPKTPDLRDLIGSKSLTIREE